MIIALEIVIGAAALFLFHLLYKAIVPKRAHTLTIDWRSKMANVTINVGGTPTTATATIRDQAGAAVAGAVFDSAPSWVFSDPTVASGAGAAQTLDVTGLKAGVTTLTVDGLY